MASPAQAAPASYYVDEYGQMRLVGPSGPQAYNAPVPVVVEQPVTPAPAPAAGTQPVPEAVTNLFGTLGALFSSMQQQGSTTVQGAQEVAQQRYTGVAGGITNFLNDLKGWATGVGSAASSATPPQRLHKKTGGIFAPFVSEISSLLGSAGAAVLDPAIWIAKSWATGEAQPLSDVYHGEQALITAPITSLLRGGGSAAENWFGVGGAENWSERAAGTVEHAVDVPVGVVDRIPGAETISNLAATIGGVAPLAAGGAAAAEAGSALWPFMGPISTALFWKGLKGGIQGIEGAIEDMREGESGTPSGEAPMTADMFRSWVENYKPPTIDYTQIPIAPIVSGVLSGLQGSEPEGQGTSMAGGGAAFMSQPPRRKKKKKLPPRPYKKHIELRNGRVSAETVRDVRNSLRTAEVPSPSQAMGGGKHG